MTPFLLGLSNTSWGGVKLPLPLDGLGLPGCRLYTSIEAVVFVRTGTRGKDRGYGFVDIPVPLALALDGTAPRRCLSFTG